MRKSHPLTRRLWIYGQLKTPGFLQHALWPRLQNLKESARLLRPYLPVCRLTGQSQDGPLDVTFTGLPHVKSVLLNNSLFADHPHEQAIQPVPFWKLGDYADEVSSDLLIVETNKHLVRRLPTQRALVLPHIQFMVDLSGDWEAVQARMRKKSLRKNELRWIRQYEYEYDVSHNVQDFDEFYDNMFVPAMSQRHGRHAVLLSRSQALQYFRHGCLLRVTRKGDWLAGVLCYRRHREFVMSIVGLKQGSSGAEDQSENKGVLGATYHAAIHHGHQTGCQAVNLQGAGLPFMDNGLFRYKRRWATGVRVDPEACRLLWIGIKRLTPAVSAFVKAHPTINVDDAGKLNGLILVDDPAEVSEKEKESFKRSYFMRGMNSLQLQSVESFWSETVDDNCEEIGAVDGATQ